MEFREDNSFDFIIDPHILELRGFNEIIAYVETAFKEYQLEFCILEMGILNEGLGETYVFANHKSSDPSKIYEGYFQLVTQFKNDPRFEGGISAYKEWYSKGTWLVIDKGDESHSHYNNLHYKWHPKFEAKSKGKYGKLTGLKDDLIKQYLNAYKDKIVEFELKNHPYYAIVVKPIGYLEKESLEVKPLGNLYLHFATKKEFDEHFLREFLRNFLLIWYKSYGGTLVSEIKVKVLSDLKKDSLIEDYLPTMPFTKPKEIEQITELLKRAYIDNEQIINHHCQRLIDEFIPLMLQSKKIIPGNEIDFTHFEEYWKVGNVKEISTGSIDMERFCRLVAGRQIALIMHVLFKYSLVEIHRLLSSGTIQDNTEREHGTEYSYFRDKHYMKTQKRISHANLLQEKLFVWSSKREKDFLNSCKEKVKTLIRPELHHKFDELSYLKINSSTPPSNLSIS